MIQHVIRLDLPAPMNWEVFLKSGINKEGLVHCYTEYMLTNCKSALREDQSLIISGGDDDKVWKITRKKNNHTPILQSQQQEEADTRLILHTIYAANHGSDSIVVISPDTDVLVLLVHHRPIIRAAQVYMLTGRMGKHTNLKRYIPCHSIYQKLTPQHHCIMLSIYCLTC